MDPYRKEISDFIRLAETLLSPISLRPPLTKEECQFAEYYVNALAGRYASLVQTSDHAELVL